MSRLGFLWVAICACLMAWVNRNSAWYAIVGWSFVGASVGAMQVLTWCGEKCLPARTPQPHPPPRKLRSRCYLVVHLDLRTTPPQVLFVTTYSCKAKDLTLTGAPEARADLYMTEADTFQEALDEMRRIQPLYFPWITPHLTRKR